MRIALERCGASFMSVLPQQDMTGIGGALGPLTIPDTAVARMDKCIALPTTPVGCVRWALRGGLVLQQSAVVVSGVNLGLNLLHDLPSSGTVMAALFAAARGRLAVAVSCESTSHDGTLVTAADMAITWVKSNERRPPELWSMNVPAAQSGDAIAIVENPEEERASLDRGHATARRLGWKFNP